MLHIITLLLLLQLVISIIISHAHLIQAAVLQYINNADCKEGQFKDEVVKDVPVGVEIW